MQLSETEYLKRRDEIIREFESWPADPVVHGYADLVLDFKYWYGDGELLVWTRSDVEALMLEWIPHNVTVPVGSHGAMAAGIRDFLAYLSESGTLEPGSDPPLALRAAVARNATEMARRCAQAASIEPRDGLDLFEDNDPKVLAPRPAADLEVATSIAGSSLAFRRLCYLHDYFAEGRKLTERGNVRLADARHLIDVLETRDAMDAWIGDRQFKTQSSADLPMLTSIVEFAKQVKVLRKYGGKLVAVKAWGQARSSPLDTVLDLADEMIDTGPFAFFRVWSEASDVMMTVLEGSIPSLLSGIYDGPIAFDRWVDLMTQFLQSHYAGIGGERWMAKSDIVSLWMALLVDSLSDLGLVEWLDFETFEEYGRERRRSGELVITELGVLWCQRRLGDFEFVIPIGDRFKATLDSPLEDLVGDLYGTLAAGAFEVFLQQVMSLGDPDELAESVRHWWKSEHPATAEVLGAIENGIPSAKVRRAAKDTRFKLRNL